MRSDIAFETPRLIARRWQRDDAEAAFRIYGDPQVARFIGKTADSDIGQTRATLDIIIDRYRDSDYGSWPLLRKDDGALVGTVLLKPIPDRDHAFTSDIEVGWHLARMVWGQGFATEAGRGCLRYAFENVQLAQVIAVVEPPNHRSHAVARRLGMHHEGITRAYYGGKELDLYRLSAAQWQTQSRTAASQPG